MSTTANLKNVYAEQIAPALQKQFNYTSSMQIPVLKKTRTFFVSVSSESRS